MLYLINNNSHLSVGALLEHIRHILMRMGLHHAADGRYDGWIYLVLAVLLSFAAMYILDKATGYILQRILQQRKAAFIEALYQSHIITHILWFIPPGCIHLVLPYVFDGIVLTILQRVCIVVLVWVMINAINTIITLLWNVLYARSRMHNRPMKGILQIVHGVCIALGCIVTVSILIDRSPMVLITGLGAFAAVLMLIFKDSILGLVAGVQLSQYDMVRNDDWITIPGTIVDGVVVDVSLNTVKVRNYDNTLIMLPPYTLISVPIQNWRGMKESGGRRIMQSVIVDINSIQFCSEELMQRISQHQFIADFIAKKGIKTYHPANDAIPKEVLSNNSVGTNMMLFRYYLTDYLMQHPDIQHEGYTLMVRTLQPVADGMPIQIYCFTTTTHWESYEFIQSQIMEYIVAIMPLFELYPFQNASGREYIAQSLIAQGYKPGDIGATGI